MARLYDRKSALVAADLLNDRVLPFFEEHGVPLLRILSAGGGSDSVGIFGSRGLSIRSLRFRGRFWMSFIGFPFRQRWISLRLTGLRFTDPLRSFRWIWIYGLGSIMGSDLIRGDTVMGRGR